MDDKIQLNKDKRVFMISAIKEFFLNERDEDLGELAAGFILDFVIDKLADEFYNQGVYDSYRFMNGKTEELLDIIKYR